MDQAKDKNDRDDRIEIPIAGDDASRAEPDVAGKLATLQAERDDLLGRLQRLSADYLNYQKRVHREIDQAQELANARLLRSLLGVLDDLERAIEHARDNHADDDPLLVGTELVYRNAMAVLAQEGVEPMETVGRAFDPAIHEAVMRQPTDQVEPMTILHEAQKGYTLRGRPLRPAKVVVATSLETEDNADPQTNGDGDDQGDRTL